MASSAAPPLPALSAADYAFGSSARRLCARPPLPTIDAANEEVLRRLLAGEPVLVDVIPAAQAIAGLADRMILHAGPPITWERMCGPLRGAIMGIAVFEGWAKDLGDAAGKAAAGGVAFHPTGQVEIGGVSQALVAP